MPIISKAAARTGFAASAPNPAKSSAPARRRRFEAKRREQLHFGSEAESTGSSSSLILSTAGHCARKTPSWRNFIHLRAGAEQRRRQGRHSILHRAAISCVCK